MINLKVGLVFEGGASRTLFTCGAIDTLLRNNIRADYVIGVSAGIAYGVDYASGQIGRNLAVATTYMHDKRYMGSRYLFDRRFHGLYNLDFVFEEIPNRLMPFDFDAFSRFEGRVIAAVTDLVTGKPEYIDLPRDDRSFKVLRASCALPILFQPEEINGRLYMDGGITDSIPYRRALEDGCDRIIVILTREHSYSKPRERAIPLAKYIYRKYPNFTRALDARADMYNETRNTLFEYEKQNKAVVIMPRNTDHFKRTEKSPERLRAMYDEGCRETEAAMQRIREYLK